MTNSPLARIGMPLLDLPMRWVAVILIVAGQIILTAPLSVAVWYSDTPMARWVEPYIAITLFALAVSFIVIGGVQRIRVGYQRQLDQYYAAEIETFLAQDGSHKVILGSYDGPYSVGAGRDPNGPGKIGIVLRIEGNDRMGIPSSITYNGEDYPIVVKYNYHRPIAL